MQAATVRRRLLAWYGRNARDLPWRRTRDPYAILVSEVMLQQTRVDVVIPYYERWMGRFPTAQALADATEDEVLRAWRGLGYYRRARNLHAAAKAIAARGTFPAGADALQSLPGVGRYTAAAVASIAFGRPEAAVDGNVTRVMARLRGLADVHSPAGKRAVAAASGALLARRRAGDWNQAVMDLGATVCTPVPRCDGCPVKGQCAAFAAGTQASIPPTKKSRAPRPEPRHFAVVRHGGRVLLAKNPDDGLLAGMWMLPGGSGGPRQLAAAVRAATGLNVRVRGVAARHRHQFTHRSWDVTLHHASLEDPEPRPEDPRSPTPIRWVDEEGLADEAIPEALRRPLLQAALARA